MATASLVVATSLASRAISPAKAVTASPVRVAMVSNSLTRAAISLVKVAMLLSSVMAISLVSRATSPAKAVTVSLVRAAMASLRSSVVAISPVRVATVSSVAASVLALPTTIPMPSTA